MFGFMLTTKQMKAILLAGISLVSCTFIFTYPIAQFENEIICLQDLNSCRNTF